MIMTFEEEFPSLKGKTTILSWRSIEDDCCLLENIEKHCKDNQRIREAIEKHFGHFRKNEECGGYKKLIACLKELGL